MNERNHPTDTPPSDALARLRAANPVTSPGAVAPDALLEEILMTPTDTDHANPDPGTPDPGTPSPSTPGPGTPSAGTPSTGTPGTGTSTARSRWLLAVAAMALVVVGVAGVLAATDDDGDGDVVATQPVPDAIGDDPVVGDEPGIIGDLPVDPGASEVTSCPVQFSLETLAGREFAFDGTVTSVDDETITFAVDEWFVTSPAVNPAPSITLAGNGQIGALLDPTTPLDVGARVLLANDGDFVPSCGFTQLYTPETADQWRAATGG